MDLVAVIGAGTMGSGIAQTAAAAGFDVKLIDVNSGALDRAISSIEHSLARLVNKQTIPAAEAPIISKRIVRSSDVRHAFDAAIVIEAVYEDEQVKRETWKGLDHFCDDKALYASNTSSISITRLAQVVDKPERFIGLHFFNPVPMMKLIEIVRGNRTSDETALRATTFAEKLGKVPVQVNDFPGFISNRVLMPMINEAIFALYENVASRDAIDNVMKLGMAHPMGPLTLADFIGLDVCLAIMNVLHEGFGDPKYRPCPLLKQMVDAGKFGRKSGEGFYLYQEKPK